MNAWEIAQETYVSTENAFYETILSLTNGAVGIRSTLDYNSIDSRPGIFVSGLYDYAISVKNQLLNIPNWLDISIFIEDELINYYKLIIIDPL